MLVNVCWLIITCGSMLAFLARHLTRFFFFFFFVRGGKTIASKTKEFQCTLPSTKIKTEQHPYVEWRFLTSGMVGFSLCKLDDCSGWESRKVELRFSHMWKLAISSLPCPWHWRQIVFRQVTLTQRDNKCRIHGPVFSGCLVDEDFKQSCQFGCIK